MEIDLPEGSAIPFLGIYPKDAPPYHKDTCSTMFIAALFVIGQKLETTQMFLKPRMDTENMVYLYNGMQFSDEK